MPDRRTTPDRQRFPGVGGALVIDTWRGKVRVRKWPEKRGPGGSQAQLAQRAWFRDVNELAKRAETGQQALAIHMTRNSGLYPRDLLLKIMSTGLYDLTTDEGVFITSRRKTLEEKVFNGAILHQNAPLAITGGGVRKISWPLPVWNNPVFWDVTNPQRLTIPNGVKIVQIGFGMHVGPSGTFTFSQRIVDRNNQFVAFTDNTESGPTGETLLTAPLVVSPGDFFTAEVFFTVNRTIAPVLATYFYIEVLETV